TVATNHLGRVISLELVEATAVEETGNERVHVVRLAMIIGKDVVNVGRRTRRLVRLARAYARRHVGQLGNELANTRQTGAVVDHAIVRHTTYRVVNPRATQLF